MKSDSGENSWGVDVRHSTEEMRSTDTWRDRYTEIALIGEGGFGRVSRVQHLSGGEDLALKVPTRPDPDVLARFRREIEEQYPSGLTRR
jgi:hypothetical protein